MYVTNPWSGNVKTLYRLERQHDNFFNGGVLLGAVSDVGVAHDWDWAIVVFLGAVWQHSEGDFEKFVETLNKVWLEEFLHMVYRWERCMYLWQHGSEGPFNFWDEERPVKAWMQLLTT